VILITDEGPPNPPETRRRFSSSASLDETTAQPYLHEIRWQSCAPKNKRQAAAFLPPTLAASTRLMVPCSSTDATFITLMPEKPVAQMTACASSMACASALPVGTRDTLHAYKGSACHVHLLSGKCIQEPHVIQVGSRRGVVIAATAVLERMKQNTRHRLLHSSSSAKLPLSWTEAQIPSPSNLVLKQGLI